MDLALRMLIIIPAFVVSIAVHEFAHAWTAHRLGDDTSARLGRLTLNPIAHLDPMGTLMLVFSSVAGVGFGWGKPVPVNPYGLRTDPRIGMGIVAVAGPISNIILATLLALPLRLDLPLPTLAVIFLSTAAILNIWLAVFNMIPLFPLDGYNVLMAILRAIGTGWANRSGAFLSRMEAQGPMVFILVILADQYLRLGLLGRILGPPANLIARVIGL